MKVMIFIDNSNFFKSINCLDADINQDRVIDYYKLHKFVLNFLSKNSQYKDHKLFHVRTYYYDGEYTELLIKKIRSHLAKIPESELNRNKINNNLEKAIKRMNKQKLEMDRMKSFYFFETRLKPLQYFPSQGVFQKGVDVQLAVDLVSNAYLNNYDIAVLFSGDIDLLESIKLVKSLGKHVIIFSHNRLMSRGMIVACDFYKDLCKLDESQLNEFTHVFEHRENNLNLVKKE